MYSNNGALPRIPGFKVHKMLGKGSYGKVYKVERESDKQLYALKEADLGAMSQAERADAVNEVRLLVSINHANVIRYNEAFLNGNKLCTVMEFAPFGDLRYYISKGAKLRTPFPEEAIWRIFLQLCKGLEALHANNIIHRDIKPANIFLCQNDLLKIGDLGIAKALTNINFARTQIGTPCYMAPEVWSGRSYSYSSDLWSLGAVLYEMMTFKVPAEGRSMQELRQRIMSGRYPPIPAGRYSAELVNYCYALLSTDPKRRPAPTAILTSAAAAKWLRVLPAANPAPARRASENGGKNLLDTIVVPRDLKQLPKKLPPAQYDEPQLRQAAAAALAPQPPAAPGAYPPAQYPASAPVSRGPSPPVSAPNSKPPTPNLYSAGGAPPPAQAAPTGGSRAPSPADIRQMQDVYARKPGEPSQARLATPGLFVPAPGPVAQRPAHAGNASPSNNIIGRYHQRAEQAIAKAQGILSRIPAILGPASKAAPRPPSSAAPARASPPRSGRSRPASQQAPVSAPAEVAAASPIKQQPQRIPLQLTPYIPDPPMPQPAPAPAPPMHPRPPSAVLRQLASPMPYRANAPCMPAVKGAVASNAVAKAYANAAPGSKPGPAPQARLVVHPYGAPARAPSPAPRVPAPSAAAVGARQAIDASRGNLPRYASPLARNAQPAGAGAGAPKGSAGGMGVQLPPLVPKPQPAVVGQVQPNIAAAQAAFQRWNLYGQPMMQPQQPAGAVPAGAPRPSGGLQRRGSFS